MFFLGAEVREFGVETMQAFCAPMAVAYGGGRYAYREETELALFDVGTGQKQTLVPAGKGAWAPAWSPDGKLLAFTSDPVSGSRQTFFGPTSCPYVSPGTASFRRVIVRQLYGNRY